MSNSLRPGITNRVRMIIQLTLIGVCLCFVTTANVWGTAVVPSGPANLGDNDPPVDPCSPTGQGNGGPATGGDPVLLRKGASIERARDIHLPGPSFDIHHKRAYQSDLAPVPGGDDLVAIQGERWTAGLISMFIRLEDADGDSSEDDVVLYMDATAKRSFIFENSVYTSPGDMTAKLTHDSNDDEYILEYTLTGDRFIFHDFTVSTTDQRGLIKRRSNRYAADEATFTYDDNLKRITQVVGPVPEEYGADPYVIDYSYLPYTDPDGGKISQIDVRTEAEGDVIQRVKYTYWSEGESPAHSSNLGTAGDLVMVQTYIMDSDDSPSDPADPTDAEFGIELVTQYRYVANHKLTHVFTPGDVERIMAAGSYSDPTDIFDLDDNDTVGSGQSLYEYASRSYTYYDPDAQSNPDPTNMETSWDSDEDLEDAYIDSGLSTINVDERVDGGWVASETVRGRQMLSGEFCGNGVTREYYYLQIVHGTDSPDKVSFVVVEDLIDANGTPINRTVYGLNTAGHKLREALIDDPTSMSPQYWCRSEILGTTGKELNRVKERRLPSAHDVSDETELIKFLYPTGSGNDNATLYNTEGAIYLFSYDTYGLTTSERVKEGRTGTPYYLSATTYGNPASNDDEAIWLPNTHYRYDMKSTSLSSGDAISYTYDFYDASDTQLKVRTTSLPQVVPGENGSNQATEIKEYYDDRGRLRWIKDGDGYVHYISYNPYTGGVSYVVLDVNTSASLPSSIEDGAAGQWLEWGATTPPTDFTRESGLPDAIQAAKEIQHDSRGRTTKLVDSEGITSYIVYLGNQVRAYPGFVADMDSVTPGNQPGPLEPITILARNDYGDIIHRIEVDPNGLMISNPPDGSESITQDDYTAWIRVDYNEQSFPQTITRYHNIPSGSSESLGTNYYQTWFNYDDRGQRTHVVDIISGTGPTDAVEQVTKYIYDDTHDHRLLEIQRAVSPGGSSESLGSQYATFTSVEFKPVVQYEYDNDGIGDGYITRIVRKHGTGNNDYTGANLHRTFRGHLRGIEPFFYGPDPDGQGSPGEYDQKPYMVFDLNWQGVDVARALYLEEPAWTGTSGVLDNEGYDFYADDTPGGRRTLAKRYLDALGRTYLTEKYNIDQSNGSKGNKFVTNRYYDRRSNLVGIAPENAAAAEVAYDGLGRAFQYRTVLALASGPYSSGVYQYRNPTPDPDYGQMGDGDDQVLSLEHLTLADNGNIERFIYLQALHGDTDGIDLTSDDDYVQTAEYRWYDDAGRLTTSADYGSGDTSSGQGQYAYYTLPTYGSAPTATADTHLVTMLEYDGAGRIDRLTDPKGLDRTYDYDDLGRRTRLLEYNSSDSAIRATLAQYNGLNAVTALIADNDINETLVNGVWTNTSNNDITEYLYEDGYNGHLRTTIEYPDSQDSDDVITLAYALDGRLTSRTDQREDGSNETTIEFTYNGRRDLTLQNVTDLVTTDVDGHVRSIQSDYDNLGRLTTVTSYSAIDGSEGAGSVRNQVELSYDALWQLTQSDQSHEGAVTGGTPNVLYGYDTNADGNNVYTNGARLISIRYPNQRVTHIQYGSAGSVSDLLSRVAGIYDDDGSAGVGSQLVSYDYLGGGAFVRTRYNEPEVGLYYDSSSTGDGDYEGFDRFGRVKDHRWDDENSVWNTDRYKYGYDENSNRIWKQATETSGNDGLYAYDDLDRLIQHGRGTLNSTFTGFGAADESFRETWTLDDKGNWSTYKVQEGASLTTTLDQSRVHNKANEIDTDDIDSNGAGASITASNGNNWFDPVYDAAGNMLEMPRRDGDATYGLEAKYDAWNRLVQIHDQADSDNVIRYEYDGFGRRIAKETYEDETTLVETRHYYYSAAWQVLEERIDSSTAADRQFIWGLRYVDDLVLRDRDTDDGATGGLGKSGSGLDERLYAIHDANFNVTALTDTSGAVQERIRYTAYGVPTFLNALWTGASDTSSKDWETLFAGYRYDNEFGLYHVRNRFYHAKLGRWLSRDPLAYVDGMNLYEYVLSGPISWVDPFGLEGLSQAELQAAYDARNMGELASVVEETMEHAPVVTDDNLIPSMPRSHTPGKPITGNRAGIGPGGSILGDGLANKASTVIGLGRAYSSTKDAIADPNSDSIAKAAQDIGGAGMGMASNMKGTGWAGAIARRLSLPLMLYQGYKDLRTIAHGVPCAIALIGDTLEAAGDAVENDTNNRTNWRNNGPLNDLTTNNLNADANNNIDDDLMSGRKSGFQMARDLGINSY